MKGTTTAATAEPSNGGKRKVETDFDDTMTRLGKVTKRKKRVTLNEKNNASVMILNDGEMPD